MVISYRLQLRNTLPTFSLNDPVVRAKVKKCEPTLLFIAMLLVYSELDAWLA